MFRVFLITIFLVTSFNAFSSEETPHRSKIKYTINLNWINNTLDNQQPFIFPGAQNSEQLREKFLGNPIGWTKRHPKDTLCIWYDSTTTSEGAIEATKIEVEKYTITLIDQVPIISEYLEEFSKKTGVVVKYHDIFSERSPVYFRTDLARVILSVCAIKKGLTNFFIFANFNMPPISIRELFDRESLKTLKIGGGLVMAFNTTGTNSDLYQKTTAFENSFFIYTGTDPLMEESLNNTLIKGSILVARHELRSGTQLSPQTAYNLYGLTFSYYYSKKKHGKIGNYHRRGDSM